MTLNFSPKVSYGHDPQKVSLFKIIQWKLTNGLTDGQTDSTGGFTFPADSGR